VQQKIVEPANILEPGTVTGQNEDISHGLQIGKDQKGDNQRDENGYQFNNLGFIDNISN